MIHQSIIKSQLTAIIRPWRTVKRQDASRSDVLPCLVVNILMVDDRRAGLGSQPISRLLPSRGRRICPGVEGNPNSDVQVVLSGARKCSRKCCIGDFHWTDQRPSSLKLGGWAIARSPSRRCARPPRTIVSELPRSSPCAIGLRGQRGDGVSPRETCDDPCTLARRSAIASTLAFIRSQLYCDDRQVTEARRPANASRL